MLNKPYFEPIAVIGMGALFPGSNNAPSFWQNIVDGTDLITQIPPNHWLIADYYDPDPKAPDKTYCKRGGFISPIAFDPVEFGIPPANVPQTDTTQLLGLKVAKQLLTDTFGKDFDKKIDLARASVILGVTSAQELTSYAIGRLQYPIWKKALREAGIPQETEEQICQQVSDSYIPWGESMFPGLLGNVVSGRIANRFNFGGTNCVTDAACASSLAALSMAVDELQLGRSDLAITGGADTLNDIFTYVCFSKTPALSLTGDCRPFSKAADGTLLGEGIGFIALKRLADAERDGNPIYAVIRGIGSSSDGRSKSVYAPVPEGQEVAIRRCYAAAGFEPQTVELIEAHGTGTIAGDSAEINGLHKAFANSANRTKPWCAVGSVKSQIGHTKAAAGAAALIKAIMAVRHKVLPPTIKVDEPNPALEVTGSPFYINTKVRPWIRTPDHLRRAGVSSFGFGGTNFHVAIEEYHGPGKLAPRMRTLPSELLLLSAQSPQLLTATIKQMMPQIAQPGSLAYIAKQSQQQFSHQHLVRLAVIAQDEADLLAKLQLIYEQITKEPFHAYTMKNLYYTYAAQPGQIALLFPGQGSQYLNMGADVLMAFDIAQTLWSEMDTILLDPAIKLHEVVFPPPVFHKEAEQQQHKQLAMTQWTQPALAVTSLVDLAILQAVGVKADYYAGHSFGELVALCAAGVFNKETLVKLARKRGELMALASNISGAMTAVVYPDIKALLEKIATWQLAVAPANYNSPEQTVFSGSEAAIAALEVKLSSERIGFRRLPVSTAFHSQIIKDSQQPFLDYMKMQTFHKPRQPVYANTTAAIYPDEPDQIREYLAKQLLSPVQFVAQIEAMYAAGVRIFIETGPRDILTNLVKKILVGKDISAISVDSKQKDGITSLWNTLGQLAVNGVKLDFSALWQEYAEPVKLKPHSTKHFTLNISGTSYGKPYPPIAADTKDLLERNLIGPFKEEINNFSPINNERITPMLRNQIKTSDLPGTRDQLASHSSDTLEKVLELYQKLQEEVARTHIEYQTLSEKSHLAYLDEARTALDEIRLLAMGQVEAAPTLAHEETDRTQRVQVAKNLYEAPKPLVKQENFTATPSVQKMAPPPTIAITAAPAPAADAVTPTVISLEPVISQSSEANEIGIDSGIQATILAIVADKTGYPEDTLSLDMDLEADLGIDSIKRVEILSAIQEQIPHLPELKPAELAPLRTFGEIAAFIKKHQGM